MQVKSLHLPAYAELLVMPALIFWALDLHESGGLQSCRMITHIVLMAIATPMLANGL